MAVITLRMIPPPSNGIETRDGGAGGGYAQRVFSSGLSAWCYYVGALNATPLPAETTPNWTGAITAYQVLGPA